MQDVNGRLVFVGGPPGPEGQSAYDDWLTLPGNAGKSLSDFIASLKGTPGRDGFNGINGAGSVQSRRASTNLAPWTAVVPVGSDACRGADITSPSDCNRVFGVTANGGAAGAIVTIQNAGDLFGAVGSFSAGPLYVGVNGALTSVRPDTASGVRWIQTVASALDPAHIVVRIDTARLTPSGALNAGIPVVGVDRGQGPEAATTDRILLDGAGRATDKAALCAALGAAAVARVAVADTAYTCAPADAYVALTGLTAPRTITLPAASTYRPGQALYIADESGLCSASLTITVSAASGDTLAGQSSVAMASAYQKIVLHSNGTNLWTVA